MGVATPAIKFDVSQLGDVLVTRQSARDGRYLLEDAVKSRGTVDLTIDFAGVTAMTASFIEEFLVKFVFGLDISRHNCTVTLSGLEAENFESLCMCLEMRNCCAVVVNSEGAASLIGPIIATEAFNVAEEMGSVTATELGVRLGISANAANNRLKELWLAGALRRSRLSTSPRGGKEFVYATRQGGNDNV